MASGTRGHPNLRASSSCEDAREGHAARHRPGVEALLASLEGDGHVEDRLALLSSHHTPGGEGSSVAQTLDRVHVGNVRVAGERK